MILHFISLHSFSSVRWIATGIQVASQIIPKMKYFEQENRNNSENEKSIELDGKMLYQKENELSETQDPEKSLIKIPSENSEQLSNTKTIIQVSEYSSSGIGKMIVWTLFMDVPIWTAKCCYYYPNFIMMILSAILPAHIWLRIFPRLLALLR
jgi:hypothetical protein